MKRLIIAMLLLLPSGVSAQTAACDKIKNTDAPYEIIQTWEISEIEKPEVWTKKSHSKKQVYRGKNGSMIVLIQERDGKVRRFSYSYVPRDPAGTHKTDVAGETVTNIYSPVADEFYMSSRDNFKLERTHEYHTGGKLRQKIVITEDFKFANSDTLKIGPCNFNVRVYDMIQTSKSYADKAVEPSYGRQKIYFSPSLKIVLKHIKYSDIFFNSRTTTLRVDEVFQEWVSSN